MQVRGDTEQWDRHVCHSCKGEWECGRCEAQIRCRWESRCPERECRSHKDLHLFFWRHFLLLLFQPVSLVGLASTLLVVSFLFLLGCINSLLLVVTKCITRSNLRECWAQSSLRSLCYGCRSAKACLVLSGEGDYFGWWLVICNKIAHRGKESMVVEHETDRLSHCVHNQEAKKPWMPGVQLAFSPFPFYLICNTFEVDLSGNMLPDIFRGVPPR